MKKSLISILAAVAALAGCQRADIDTISSEKYADSYSFSAQIVQPGDADSKLGLDATGLQMFWESGDEILVSSDEASLVSFNTNENGAAVNFYSGTVLEGKYFDAYYGLGATADNLPATFANYIPGDVKHLPLYAHSTSRQLTFNCATAVLKVCTYNVGSQNVDKVTVTSDLDIAGDVEFNNSVMSVSGTKTITLTTSSTDESKIFYVPVVPGSHQLTIKSYCGANLVGEMTTKSSVAVSAKTVYTIFLGKVFYIYKDKVECKNPDDGETSAQTAAKYVSFTTSGTTYTYTLLKDGNYNIVAGEQFDGDNDKVELKTATEAPVPSVPNIFFDGAQNTIMTLDINTPASHVEIEQGISKYVNSITSATTLVIKPTYKILEDAVLKAGAIIIEGNPAATVKSQDSHVNTVVLDPESAQTPVSVSIVNDANVKIIKNQSQYDVAADINVTDVAYVGQIINSSTTNTSSVEIEVKKEGQIGKVKNEDTTNTLNVDTDGQKDIQTEGDVNIASNVAKIGETKYTTIAAAMAAAEEGQTIVLLTDITLEEKIDIGKSLDFDLGGYTVTGPAESEKSYVFSYDGYEASPDHSKRISGKVYNGTINCNKIGVYAADHADVVIEGLTVNQKKTTDDKVKFNHCAIAASYGSTLTVNGGTYNGDIAAGIFNTGGHIIINEGTFKGETYALDVYPASSPEAESDSEISVIGGVIYGALKIEDGVGIKGFEKKITVAGGTFDNDPSAYIIPGYHAVPSGHFYNVEAIDPVAKIGTFTFASLEDAIAAVPADGSKTVITLLADITTTEANGFAIAKGKSAVIDLNARTITANLENTGACAVFNIANGASLVMKDSQDGGQVILTPAVPGDPASSKNFGTSVFQNNGSLTIESGYYENKGNGGSSYVVDNNSNSVEATAIINDGYFKAVKTPVRMCCNSTQYSNNLTINGGEIESGRYGVILASQNKDANKANLIVNGGRITTTDSYKLDIYIQANSGANTSAIFATINDVDCPQNIGISGSITAANINILGGKIGEVEPWGNQKVVSGGIYTVSPSDYLKEGFEVVANTDEETKTAYPYAIAKLEPVAKIGTAEYYSLASAFTGAAEGQTIELLKNCSSASTITVDKSLTLDLKEYTLTLSMASWGFNAANGIQFTLKNGNVYDGANGAVWGVINSLDNTSVSRTGITVKDVDFGTFNTDQGALVRLRGNVDAIIENVSATTNNRVISGDGSSNSASVKDCEITDTYGFKSATFIVNGCKSLCFDSVKINGTESNQSAEARQSLIEFYPGVNADTVVVKNCTLTNAGPGNILYAGGNLKVINCTIESTSTCSQENRMSAVGVESEHRVKVYGGTYKSAKGHSIKVFSSGGFIDIYDKYNGEAAPVVIEGLYSLYGDTKNAGEEIDHKGAINLFGENISTKGKWGTQHSARIFVDGGFHDVTVGNSNTSNLILSGGTYTMDPRTNNCFKIADGYEVKAQGTDPETWKVVVNPFAGKVAKIGSVGYATFPEALGALQDNQTVTLLENVSVPSTYTWESGLYIKKNGSTLDLNGKTMTVANSSAFIAKGTDITVKNGSISCGGNYGVMTENATNFKLDAVSFANTGINITNSSTAVIKDCSVSGAPYSAIMVQKDNSEVTIQGGTYSPVTPAESKGCGVITLQNGKNIKVYVDGGTFTGNLYCNEFEGAQSGKIYVSKGDFKFRTDKWSSNVQIMQGSTLTTNTTWKDNNNLMWQIKGVTKNAQ